MAGFSKLKTVLRQSVARKLLGNSSLNSDLKLLVCVAENLVLATNFSRACSTDRFV